MAPPAAPAPLRFVLREVFKGVHATVLSNDMVLLIFNLRSSLSPFFEPGSQALSVPSSPPC